MTARRCDAAKIPFSGFRRNVTLLHAAALPACRDIRAQLIRCSSFVRLEHGAKASSSLRYIDVRPVGVLAFSN